MKIAFLSFYSGYVNRGVETFVHEVARRLAKSHHVDVFQGGPSKKGAPYNTFRSKIRVDWKNADSTGSIRRKFLADYWSRLLGRAAFETARTIWAGKYDILIPTNGGWQVVVCQLLSLLGKGKMVISGQSGPGRDDWWNLLWRPAAFVALTEEQRRWAKSRIPWVRLEKIPNGVDLDKFSSEVRPAKLELERPIILCVGALVPIKRIHLAIKAVARLRRASLLVLGEGQLEDYLNRLGKKELGEQFSQKDVAYEEIHPFYRAADLFTLPTSPQEAFGNVFVEAMASGLAVVAPDDPVRREIVGDSGLFVDPQDTEAYAEALERALKIDWGDKPRRQAEKFSWDRIAKEYENLFQELVK